MNRIASNIYKYKVEMMGLAIILIMLFHTIAPNLPYCINEIKRFGEVGVDIFLFLGGFTCANSYMKSKSVQSFYKKRLVRILPAYLIIWGFIHAIFAIRYSEGFLSYLQDISFYNVIIYNDLRNWYIPAILIMYVITPLYLKVCKHGGRVIPYILVCVFFILFQFVGIQNKEIPFAMFWLRLPIYFIGINAFLCKDKKIIGTKYIALFAILSIIFSYLILYYHLTEAPFQIRRFLYIPITIAFVYFFEYKSKFLFFIGGLTLELYLIHEFLQGIIWDKFSPHPLYLFVFSISLSLICSFLIHRLLNKLHY